MTKCEAIAIVRAKYPRAIVVKEEAIRMSVLLIEPTRPKSSRFATSGPASATWAIFAGYILKGADF